MVEVPEFGVDLVTHQQVVSIGQVAIEIHGLQFWLETLVDGQSEQDVTNVSNVAVPCQHSGLL
jgi:hypothetical protein